VRELAELILAARGELEAELRAFDVVLEARS
jgi:hypothetical protein